jgi:hypothetical protein
MLLNTLSMASTSSRSRAEDELGASVSAWRFEVTLTARASQEVLVAAPRLSFDLRLRKHIQERPLSSSLTINLTWASPTQSGLYLTSQAGCGAVIRAGDENGNNLSEPLAGCQIPASRVWGMTLTQGDAGELV